MPGKAEDMLKEMGFTGLPAALKGDLSSPEAQKAAVNAIKEQHDKKEASLIDKAPVGIDKNKPAIMNKPQHAPFKEPLVRNDHNEKLLTEMIMNGTFAQERDSMSETFKNGAANAAAQESAKIDPMHQSQYDHWVKKKDEYYEKRARQIQIGPKNLFLYLLALLKHTLNSHMGNYDKEFNIEAPVNLKGFESIKSDSPETVKNFVEAAKKEFGDDVRFNGYNADNGTFESIDINPHRLQDFDTWYDRSTFKPSLEDIDNGIRQGDGLEATPVNDRAPGPGMAGP